MMELKNNIGGKWVCMEAIQREHSIDLLKTLAIFGVIIIHSCSAGYATPVGSFDWTASLFWGSLTRASVPVFLMCSGALLLEPKKELTLKKLYSHNVLRLIAAMLFWAMLYKMYYLVVGGALSVQGVWQGFQEVLLFRQEFHFYFIHIILLVYAFLPVSRILVCNGTKKQLEYTLALWFVVAILYPTIRPFWPFSLLTGISAQYMLNMTYAAIGYGILGHYLKKYSLPPRVCAILFAAGLLFVFGGTWVMSIRTGVLYQNFLEGMSVGVCLMATGIFGLCVSLKGRPPKGLGTAITYLSKASFCMYLVHVFFLYILTSLGLTASILPCLVSIPLIAAANALLSFCIYLALSKIPVVSRWLV